MQTDHELPVRDEEVARVPREALFRREPIDEGDARAQGRAQMLGRDLTVGQMPGVVQDRGGGLHFNGSAENQVLYVLNGFNITDPITGEFHTHLSVEGIRSLEFMSGRYSPEFGKRSAGALVIHTENGADAHIDKLSKKYTGKDVYPNRRPGEVRVIYRILPEKIFTKV